MTERRLDALFLSVFAVMSLAFGYGLYTGVKADEAQRAAITHQLAIECKDKLSAVKTFPESVVVSNYFLRTYAQQTMVPKECFLIRNPYGPEK